MMALVGDWGDMEKMLKNLVSRPVREKIGGLIDAAKAEDSRALEEIRRLYDCVHSAQSFISIYPRVNEKAISALLFRLWTSPALCYTGSVRLTK